MLAGAILLAIGILGEYVGRIWEQVRSRPNYLLKFDSQQTAQQRAHQPPHIKVFEAVGDVKAKNRKALDMFAGLASGGYSKSGGEDANAASTGRESPCFGGRTNPWADGRKSGHACFFLFLLALGGVVELPSAFLERRMGDLDVFLRAAWAVRTGGDLYAVTSDNGWHYIYPPLYAIFMTPLADPPREADTAGYLPIAVSVAICYLLNHLSLFAGAHVLASALEDRAERCEFFDAASFLPALVDVASLAHSHLCAADRAHAWCVAR